MSNMTQKEADALSMLLMVMLGANPADVERIQEERKAEAMTAEELSAFKVGDRVRIAHPGYVGTATVEVINPGADRLSERLQVNEQEAAEVHDSMLGMPMGPFWGHLRLERVEPTTTSTGAVETHG